jgi:hypothetical protein
VQPLVLKGLLFPATENAALRLLCRAVGARADALVDPTDGRLCFAAVGALPYLMVHAGTAGATAADASADAALPARLAAAIATAADVANQPALAKWFRGPPSQWHSHVVRRRSWRADQWGCSRLVSVWVLFVGYAKRRKIDDDAIKQVVAALREGFFPRYEVASARFLLAVADAGPVPTRRPALAVLRCLMPTLAAHATAGAQATSAPASASTTIAAATAATTTTPASGFLGAGGVLTPGELLGPLFRLLSTDCAEDALAILEATVQSEMAAIARYVSLTQMCTEFPRSRTDACTKTISQARTGRATTSGSCADVLAAAGYFCSGGGGRRRARTGGVVAAVGCGTADGAVEARTSARHLPGSTGAAARRADLDRR